MIKKFRFIFLLLILSSSLFAQIESFITTGNEKLLKKNYEGALADFKKALTENPGNIQALNGSALAQNGLGNPQEALLIAESAIQLNNQKDAAFYVKGEILSSMKDFAGAILAYNAALEINPASFQSTIGKSKAYNQLGNVKEAYKILDEAIEKYPSNSELLIARGLLNNNKEKYSKALDDFDKAISLDDTKNAFSAHFNRGITYSYLQEYEPALSDFNKAAELDPTNANAFHSRALANYQLGNFEASVKDFEQSNELNPNNSVTLYNLGMAYYKLEDIENACMYFHKSCSMNNTNSCKMIIMVCSDKQKK